MTTEQPRSSDIFKGEIITEGFLKCMREAGALALQTRAEGIGSEVKSTKEDIVTKGDLEVSKFLRAHLSGKYPGIAFMDEEVEGSESLDVTQHALVAVIDPIDGTTNYYNNGKPDTPESPANPNWGISVGIVKNGELVAGAIYQPQLDRMFYAEKGKGAYVNGTRMHVSSTNSLSNARLQYDYPYPKDAREFALTSRVMPRLEKEVGIAYRIGSQVIATMGVAQGKADMFVHLRTKPWDVAAAVLIVQEAGGVALNVTGEPFALKNKSIVLTNGRIDVSKLIQIVYEELKALDLK